MISSESKYSEYLDEYTAEIAISLPIIFVLGTLMNKRHGSVYSCKFLLASYFAGFYLKYTRVGIDVRDPSPTVTVASALLIHALFKSWMPFYGSIG